MANTSMHVDELMILLGRNQVEIYALQKENAQLKSKLEQINKASNKTGDEIPGPRPVPPPPVDPTS